MANSTKISEYSTTAANNTSIDSIDIDENCAASGINNAIRSVLKHQADAFTQGTPIALDQTNNRVGIGTSAPDNLLTISGGDSGHSWSYDSGDLLIIEDNDSASINIATPAANSGNILFSDANARGQGRIAYTHSSDKMEFMTGGISNTRMTIDSSGDIGIGTSSITNTSGYRNIHIDSPTSGMIMRMYANGTHVGQIQSASDQLQFNAITSIPMIFKTNNTERMRLQANGRFNIHTTGDIGPAALQVRDDNEACIGLQRGGGTSGYFNYVLFANNGNTALIGSIQRVNDASVQYNTTSDARLKENIADMTGAITRVKQLAPKRYSWVNEDLDAADQDGFLAHETQTVVPGAVSGTQDEVDADGNPVYMQMDYSKLVPLLTGALQEAIAKIETLETEMTALKARVTALEA